MECDSTNEGNPTEKEQIHLKFGCLRSFRCGLSSINCVRFFGDADHLLAASSDKTVYLLGAQHGILHEFSVEHTDAVSCVGSDSSLTELFLSGGLDRRGILWDVATGGAVRQFPRTSPIHACLLRPSQSPLNRIAALGDAEGSVRLFDVRSRDNRFGYIQVLNDAKDAVSRQAMTKLVRRNSLHHQTLNLNVLATQDMLLVASLDGCIYTYDLRKGKLHADCYGSPITCVSLSADGTVLLISCVDASVRLIETTSGECLHAFWGHRQTADGGLRLSSDFVSSSLPLPSRSDAATLFSTDLESRAPEPPRAFDELLETVQRSTRTKGGISEELASQRPYAGKRSSVALSVCIPFGGSPTLRPGSLEGDTQPPTECKA
ncbi:wd repeat domain-containing protein [Cyclospora cayetanensis]|uniref:Wd repeat domain-containing protein n=1 Tax=Cyclospora cayetanensis TaxID=88456 RepID=A0A1D3CV18_9EIME|nr:wd repeat domain-containing protein [Cyclospora cayetanensis]